MTYSSGIHLPPLRGINKIIIIVIVVSFITISILNAVGVNLTGTLSLSGHTALKGHIYQFISYPLVSHSLLEVIFHSMIFWFIGDELENIWGQRRYLIFLGASFFIAGIIYALVEFFSGAYAPLSGTNGVVSSLCLAYAILFPDRIFSFMMLFPVKAKYFCMILIGMSLFNLFLSAHKLQALGHLLAMGVAFGTLIVMTKAKSLKSGSTRPWLKRKKKGHLHLVKDDDQESGSSKYWH